MKHIYFLSYICFALLLPQCAFADNDLYVVGTIVNTLSFAEAQQLKTIIEQQEESIDFARVKLTIDKMIDPSIDVEANLQKIDAIVKTINTLLLANATSMDKMLAIKKYLYEAGAWNDFKPYQYDFNNPKGTLIRNKLLPNYLASKQGNCVSMPLLFIVLGQRLGIDVTASTAPNHVFVKFTDEITNTTYNLETTSGADFNRDIWIQQVNHVTDDAIRNKIYLQKLSKQETVVVIATVLAESYFKKQEYDKSIMVSDLLLQHYKKDVGNMLRIGSAYFHLEKINFMDKYPTPNLIPANERAYFQYLLNNSEYWFTKAEVLGWRQPTKEDEENYLKIVKEAGKLQIKNKGSNL